jgi:hypothetical protein
MFKRFGTGFGLLLGVGLVCADPAAAGCYYCNTSNICASVTGGNGYTFCTSAQSCGGGRCGTSCQAAGTACTVGGGSGGDDCMDCVYYKSQVVPNGEPTSMWRPVLWAGYQSRPAAVRGVRRSCVPTGAV